MRLDDIVVGKEEPKGLCYHCLHNIQYRLKKTREGRAVVILIILNVHIWSSH